MEQGGWENFMTGCWFAFLFNVKVYGEKNMHDEIIDKLGSLMNSSILQYF